MAQANSLPSRIPSGDQIPPPIPKYTVDELAEGLFCVLDREGHPVLDEDFANYLDAEATAAFLEADDAEAEAEAQGEALEIITTHVAPSVPHRSFDWCAHYEGHEEGPYGTGRTEAEAIIDLVNNYDEPECG